LESKSININHKNKQRHTSLYSAIQYGHLEIAQFLIEKGANVNAKNRYDATPLQETVQR